MRVAGEFGERQGDRLLAVSFVKIPVPQSAVAPANMHRHPAAQVGQPEVGATVSAVNGAEDRKQFLVIVDREQLAVGEVKALGQLGTAVELDFADERLAAVIRIVRGLRTAQWGGPIDRDDVECKVG